MDNFVQNLRKKLAQPQQQMRIPQPVARQVNTFVNNLNNMNFQTKRPNPVQFQAPKLEMPKIQLPKFNAIGQSRPNIPQAQPINIRPIVQRIAQQPIINTPLGNRIPSYEQAVKQIPSLWQEPAKFGTGLALSARNSLGAPYQSFYQASNPATKLLVGKQPIKNFEGQSQDVSRALQKAGIKPNIANKAGASGVLALGALNVLPGGGAKRKAVEAAAKKATTVEEFIKIIRANKGLAKTAEGMIKSTENSYKTLPEIYQGVRYGSNLAKAGKMKQIEEGLSKNLLEEIPNNPKSIEGFVTDPKNPRRFTLDRLAEAVKSPEPNLDIPSFKEITTPEGIRKLIKVARDQTGSINLKAKVSLRGKDPELNKVSSDSIIPRDVNAGKGVIPKSKLLQEETLLSQRSKQGINTNNDLLGNVDQNIPLSSPRPDLIKQSGQLLPENYPVKSGSDLSTASLPSEVSVPNNKYAFNINKTKLKLNQEQKKVMDQAVSSIKPELEKIKGKKLTFNEVRNEAKTAEFLRKTVDRATTQKFEASLLATRERMTTLDSEITRLTQAGDTEGAKRLSGELIDLIKINSSNAADIGRKLGSFRIMAEEKPFRERVLEEVIRTGKLTDEVAEQMTQRAANLDWNDAREVQKFFREFVKPSWKKIAEEYRYINLLSSPKTHITNMFSNALQAGVTRPATKLVSGMIDPVAQALSGGEREYYIMEVPVYYRGMLANMPKAFEAFRNVMSGKTAIQNLDMRTLASGTGLTKYNVVSKALSGMDEFFQTIIKGGETEAFKYKFAKNGQKVSDADIETLAKQEALYSVFRQPLDPSNKSGQGNVLSWVDKGTEAILGLRKVPGMGWFIPFVQTPMNIFKQGIEYSPLGVTTLKGNTRQTEQIAKSVVGSSVFMMAGFMAAQGRLTWDTPKDPEAKKAFYAAGYQPYSVKIGDKWVSYSRLGPLAYPLALAAGVKYAYKDDPNAAANGQIDKITNALTGIVGFFGDQTYVQGLGNLVKVAQGEEGYSKSTATVGNIVGQYVPAASLLRWVTSVVDPVYRKSDGVVDQIKKGIPGLSTQVGFYEDPYGEPSKRQYPAGNAFSPFNVTKENPEFKDLYDTRKEELQTNAQIRFEEKRLEKEAKEGVSGLEADASGSYLETLGKAKEKEVSTKTSTFDDSSGKSLVKLEAEDELARKKAKLKQEIIRQNGKIYVPSGDSVKVIDLNPEKKKGTGIASFVKEKDKYASAREVWNLDIPQEQKNEIFKDLGVDPQDVRYDALTGYNNEIKTQYIVSKDMTHDQLLNRLIRGRVVSVSGDIFATDGVLKSLLDQNLISGSEYGTLKKLKLDKNGKSLTPVKVGSGGSRKKVKYDYTGLASKLQSSPIKLKKTKLNKVKLGRSNSKSGGMLEGSNKYIKGFKNI